MLSVVATSASRTWVRPSRVEVKMRGKHWNPTETTPPVTIAPTVFPLSASFCRRPLLEDAMGRHLRRASASCWRENPRTRAHCRPGMKRRASPHLPWLKDWPARGTTGFFGCLVPSHAVRWRLRLWPSSARVAAAPSASRPRRWVAGRAPERHRTVETLSKLGNDSDPYTGTCCGWTHAGRPRRATTSNPVDTEGRARSGGDRLPTGGCGISFRGAELAAACDHPRLRHRRGRLS